MDHKYNKEDLIAELRLSTLDDLSYLLGRYCGPHNILLAYKKYGDHAKDLQRLINLELASREFDKVFITE